MFSDRQVRLLRKKRMENKTLEAAASAAGMSERTARVWQRGPMPSATKEPRTWRTRPDPFVEVWTMEIEPLPVADKEGKFEAKTLFAELCRKRPGVFEHEEPLLPSSSQTPSAPGTTKFTWPLSHGPHARVPAHRRSRHRGRRKAHYRLGGLTLRRTGIALAGR